MKIGCLLLAIAVCIFGCREMQSPDAGQYLILSKEALKDKIKGGWAGQVIGVTFGGPYEFGFQGSFIQDYQPLAWPKGYIKKTMTEIPGLYDDLYMDLIFMNTIEKYGINAPADSFAHAFAYAGFKLWHANQSARYNILNGIHPPASGHYRNNPHADDIDFQIESDFAGLMCPGMPNTAAAISDKVGHIMCYGDGWYGGVFISTMYTLAFTERPINAIVEDALKSIPPASTFHRCIADVIQWHAKYPDWHDAWFALQMKWSEDIGCPDGVFNAFDIDAKLNAAYVVLGLLYGNGDFGKSVDIATRAGEDADCNPSTVAGIIGTKIGYEHIPPIWKTGLKEVEPMDFLYTNMSLDDAYETGFKHALHTIRSNGGTIDSGEVRIKRQEPVPVRLEQSLAGLYPWQERPLSVNNLRDTNFSFYGKGFVVRGSALPLKNGLPDLVLYAEISIDGKNVDTIALPTSFTERRNEIYWNYDLKEKEHTFRIKILNPAINYAVSLSDCILYKGQR